jgi:type IV secretory pathway ATPase VirB11/archaellum biosynthesis ATPase
MKEIFYRKVGRRYVPVAEYDSNMLDSLPQGAHLVVCVPGGQSRRYNIDPNYAAMIAAGRVAEDAICDAIREADQPRPQRMLLTERQRRAWRALARALGDEMGTLVHASHHDIAEAAVRAMQAEADKLMQHPAVRNAYEQFQTVVKLTQQTEC